MRALERVEAVVVGAGVVGLAAARALALRGIETLVLEAERAVGTGISSRNSEVIHAGIYYPAGSLKARCCVRGAALLFDYCASRGVAHRRIGKLIVAAEPAQQGELERLEAAGRANGVEGLRLLTRGEAQAAEPQLACSAALASPATGIVDSHGLMLALQGDFERAGGTVVLGTPVLRARVAAHDFVVETGGEAPMALGARLLVNAAGLGATALARRFEGLDPSRVPRLHRARGHYFSLSGVRAPFRRLIYPVPEPGGLGIHLTLDLGGQARFGPDVQWLDDGAPEDYAVDPARAAAFYGSIRRYWPALPDGALQPAYSGIRPKLSGPGEPAADFMLQTGREHGVAGLVQLFGIESPGLTSCLALAEDVMRALGVAGW